MYEFCCLYYSIIFNFTIIIPIEFIYFLHNFTDYLTWQILLFNNILKTNI